MRLFEHRDFDQAVLQASEHFRDRGLRPALIEKDYYVTEALRIIASQFADKVIFKGGTSLLSLGAEDEGGFSMRLLHFRRTFVEKLFAIHGKVELLKRDGRPVGSYARHYYDLFQLAGQREVTDMLATDEYAAIKTDYDAISRDYSVQSYFPPQGMSFANSDALFPPERLEIVLGEEYETQCRQLCLGPYPSAWWARQDGVTFLLTISVSRYIVRCHG